MSHPGLHGSDRRTAAATRRRSATVFWRSLLVFIAAAAAQLWVVADVTEPARTLLLAVTIAVEYALLAWLAGSRAALGL